MKALAVNLDEYIGETITLLRENEQPVTKKAIAESVMDTLYSQGHLAGFTVAETNAAEQSIIDQVPYYAPEVKR